MFDIKTLNRILVGVGLPVRRKHNKNVRRDIANDYLNYSFGWKPFIGDLISAYNALKNLDKRLDYLKRNANRVIRRNVSIDLTNYSIPATVTAWTDCNLGFYTNRTRFHYFQYQPRYHATLVYRYTLPSGRGAVYTKMKALLDAFGVRPDFSIIWNAIPFSFVVDWFVDVGGFLRSFTPTDLDMKVSVLDYSQSVKYVQSTQTDYTIHHDFFGPQVGGPEIAGTVDKGYYERDNDIPSLHALSLTGLNLMQASLGGALVLSNSKGGRSYRRPSRM